MEQAPNRQTRDYQGCIGRQAINNQLGADLYPCLGLISTRHTFLSRSSMATTRTKESRELVQGSAEAPKANAVINTISSYEPSHHR